MIRKTLSYIVGLICAGWILFWGVVGVHQGVWLLFDPHAAGSGPIPIGPPGSWWPSIGINIPFLQVDLWFVVVSGVAYALWKAAMHIGQAEFS